MADNNISIGNGTLTLTGQFVSVPFQCDPITIGGWIDGGAQVTGSPPSERDPFKDVYFNCGFRDKGVIQIGVSAHGANAHNTVFCDPITSNVEVYGTDRAGQVNVCDPITVSFVVRGDQYRVPLSKNWVAWARPGVASSLIDRTNLAGKAPLEFPGWVTMALQLGAGIMVYGLEGIALMQTYREPIDTFGFVVLSRLGLLSARSVTGNTDTHYFIARTGELYQVTDKGLENLGYKEYFENMVNPQLFYEERERRLWINDGGVGYCFQDGLGGGYGTLTGVSGGLYAAQGDILDAIPMEIVSDILDLGHRGIKQVTFIEVGTDASEDLYVCLDFRYNKSEAWRTSPWVLLNDEGVARVTVSATEFRVRLKQNVYDDISIDYINIRHQRAGKRYLRGPLFEQSQRGQGE